MRLLLDLNEEKCSLRIDGGPVTNADATRLCAQAIEQLHRFHTDGMAKHGTDAPSSRQALARSLLCLSAESAPRILAEYRDGNASCDAVVTCDTESVIHAYTSLAAALLVTLQRELVDGANMDAAKAAAAIQQAMPRALARAREGDTSIISFGQIQKTTP